LRSLVSWDPCGFRKQRTALSGKTAHGIHWMSWGNSRPCAVRALRCLQALTQPAQLRDLNELKCRLYAFRCCAVDSILLQMDGCHIWCCCQSHWSVAAAAAAVGSGWLILLTFNATQCVMRPCRFCRNDGTLHTRRLYTSRCCAERFLSANGPASYVLLPSVILERCSCCCW
jgi:hypothetical protein